MQISLGILGKRRFLPLFLTQFLGAFNDNLFKQATILLAVFVIYSNPKLEQGFTGIAYAAYVLPFFLFSALAGQMSDALDKALIIRWIKTIEIGIMFIGATGLIFQNIHLLVLVLFLMGTHSSFFGPTKYAILPQHLGPDEVLSGTSLVEAGTNIAILAGIIIGGLLGEAPVKAGALVLGTALLGFVAGRSVPSALPEGPTGERQIEFNLLRATWHVCADALKVPQLRLSIAAISLFVIEASILGVIFAPLVKNILGGDHYVATLMTVVFAIGVAIGAVIINFLLHGKVSAHYCVMSAIAMAVCLVLMYVMLNTWPLPAAEDIGQIEWRDFLQNLNAEILMAELLGVAIFGGMFIVPLYAILTTTLDKAH
ncbi:MAG: MFS transporter, partial [Alphaproteobacteria bacterium]|nr:MFS transporter [Alphaproteobacteria bacterium]